MKKKQKSGVEIVRQRGGDCLESVRQRVKVVREAEAGGVMEVMDLEKEQQKRVRDQRAVAEVRGREAETRLARDNWLEDKLTQAEVERKESVRLMEMLRSARVISEARSGEDKTKERPRRSDEVTANKKQDVRKDARVPVDVVKVAVLQPLSPDRLENLTLRDDTIYIRNRAEAVMQKRDVDKLSRKVASLVEKEGSHEKNTTQKSTQKHKPILIMSSTSSNIKKRDGVDGRKETNPKGRIVPSTSKEKIPESKNEIHDDPDSMSGLSTILEVTENMTSSRHPGAGEEASPFPHSELLSHRSARGGAKGGVAEMDLVAVRRLIDRVKRQGEQIKLTDAHYLNVSGTSVGPDNKAADDTNVGAGGKKYEVNQNFIEKVLNFSSSQSLTLSSDESSVFRPVKLPSPKTVPLSSGKMQPLHPQGVPKQFFEQSFLSPIPKTVSLEKKQGHDKVSMLKNVEIPKTSQSLSHAKAFSERNQQLRYYILKLLKMKHDEVEDLSVTSTDNSAHEASRRFCSRLGVKPKSNKYDFSSSCDKMKISTNSSSSTN